MRIDPPAAPPAPAAARALQRGRNRAQDFALPEEAEECEAPAASAPPPPPVLTGVSCVLAQAAPGGPGDDAAACTDREAAGHGRALLSAPAGLHLAALGGDGVQARQTLSDLARALPHATDPGLDEVLRAIAQRAAIELARAG